MLASLLPGFRDLRVPLATGFLWLVVVWLATYPVIPTLDEASGLAEEVYRILGALGPAALVAVLSFVAYIIGVLLVRPGTAIVQFLLRVVPTSGRRLSMASSIESRQLARKVALNMVRAGVSLPPELSEMQPYVERRGMREESDLSENELVSRIAATLTTQMYMEISLVATRLLADSRDLFDRYDRAEAEAAFRFGVALPLVAISALLPWRLDLDGWGFAVIIAVGFLVAGALILEGTRKQIESNDAIFQAVFSDKADFPSIEAARTDIAQALALEQQRAEERTALKMESRNSEQRAEEEAGLVTIALKGGRGQNSVPNLEMVSLHVEITNDSDRPVVIEKFALDPPLKAIRYPQFHFRLAANDEHKATLEVEPIPIDAGELSGNPISEFTAEVVYKLGDRRWTRNSAENSRPVLLG
ncbi:hypothetical protein HD599_001633 [Conyzicola lurida]|uniref:Uncharacterized protein n=1 Tax=Conyzicola lurida TaxID=1172621 RepID=A0A841AHJ8_9MICO|nr:hypothetical protein [Conyzicola lurida]MBB5843310.1 hypothetical protein [Conyzicola lurida]